MNAPLATLVERAFGAVSTGEPAVLILAKVVRGVLGALLANLMFDLPAVNISTRDRSGSGIWLGEVVATLGLVVTFGTIRSGRGGRVGGYITAAHRQHQTAGRRTSTTTP